MTTTTNMSLVLPDVGVTVGPTYATQQNTAMTTIDAHDHSTGKGIKITPSGINISSDLTFAQNNATNLRTARLYNNSSFTPTANDLTAVYALNNELYFRDGSGNAVQITSAGAVNLGGTVTALTLNDSSFFLQYFGDVTKKARFDNSLITPGVTRIFSLPEPGANDTLVSDTSTSTMTNKTLTAAIISGSTAVTLVSGSGTLTLPTSGTVTVPNGTDTLVNLTGSQTLTGKILTGNTIATFTPNAGTNTITVPAITDTLVTKTSSDTLTNKTLTAPIFSNYEDLTAIATPATPGAGVLRVYSKSDNKLYKKDSTGLEQVVGSGSGSGINYISNSDFEDGTVTGWATYADAAATTPVNGTGGSPASTFAINSSSPLRGTYDAVFTKSAANRQGEGFSYDFTLASADVGKTLQVTFDSKASANVASGDIKIYAYDVTNSVLITPSSVNVPTGTSSQYSVCFNATTSTSYRIIFHVATTNATAYTLEIDQIAISPVVRPMVAGISDWISYSPTGSWGNTTYTGMYRRVGDTLEFKIGLTLTGAPSGNLTFTSAQILNGLGLTYNPSKNASNADKMPGGLWAGVDTGTADYQGLFSPSNATNTTPTFTLLFQSGAATTASVSPTAPFTWASGDEIGISGKIAITEWSSNITLASTVPMIEYVYNTAGTTTAGASDTTSFGYGAAGAAIGSIASTTVSGNSNTTMRVRFQNPVQSTDRVQLEVQVAGTGPWHPSSMIDAIQTVQQGAGSFGMAIRQTSGTTTDFDVNFGNGGRLSTNATYASAGSAWSGISTWRWRLAKYSSVGAAELAPATSTSSGTISRENTWTAYTPTLTGVGTATNVSAFYKVLGDSLYVKGSFTGGTVTAAVVSVTIPTAFTIASSKLSLANTTANPGNFIGQMSSTAANQFFPVVTATGTSTSVVYAGGLITASNILTPGLGSTIMGSTQVVAYHFEVPIV